jgi:hypothetical protein
MATVLLLLFALAAVEPEANQPADWSCADPLVQKNYAQRVPVRDLARRIADECAVPYRPRPIQKSSDEVFESMEQTTYRTKAEIFVLDIESKILKARRRDAIPLKH